MCEQTVMKPNRPLPLPLTDSELLRFNRSFERGADTEACWPWTKAKRDRGYGMFSCRSATWPAHRLALAVFLQKDLGDRIACHACNNTSCVNPLHIYAGDAKSNAQDRVKFWSSPSAPSKPPRNKHRPYQYKDGNPSRRIAVHYCTACGHERIDDYIDSKDNRRCRNCQKSRDKNKKLKK